MSFGSLHANAWRRAFLRNFRKAVTPLLHDRANAVVKRTAASAQQLFDDRRGQAPDKQGLWMVGLCSLMLAGYRELQAERLDRTTAYEAVRSATLATHRVPSKWLTRLLLVLSRDPVSSLSRMPYLPIVRRAFGTGFGFEERHSAGQIDLVVTRCAVNRFFVDHGEPQLTLIGCEWDRNWIDEVNSSKRPIVVKRPMTIEAGCERCEFQHIRAARDTGPCADIALQRGLELTASLSERESS